MTDAWVEIEPVYGKNMIYILYDSFSTTYVEENVLFIWIFYAPNFSLYLL